ncbi:bromodomain and PHD finger-containing protein [Drechmeria coniospora]|uniref:Bromodomain and PHD finger-containing protein n=1 Tax=Drechmeria coniospora TaxID=98403 RepID=A0A151GSP0_DRECN|nr:bromodomain and PHD finger-containing protein [Drechmeria coniospora]KYK60117.1 bromodomain and PHD finger-containing protein [Drechmeria coniospora]
MAPASPLPRRTPTGRRRGRPPGTTNAARAARQASLSAMAASEPPSKKRRYVPGGPGGGGRFVDSDSLHRSASAASAPTSRSSRNAARDLANGDTPSAPPRRERSARRRVVASEDTSDLPWGSAAAMAASVKQAEDYKPREERGWEEFHPDLDIEKTFMVFTAVDTDPAAQPAVPAPSTPARQAPPTPLLNGSLTPSRHVNPASTGNTPNPQENAEPSVPDTQAGTPSRRPRRQTREAVSFYGTRPIDFASTPKTPKILPIHNQTPKERLDLKLPSYRKTNRIELFESKTFGQARYVDKAMSNVGYQGSDRFPRSDRTLIKAIDGSAEDEVDMCATPKAEDHVPQSRLGRVEYDMDEQDDMWLEQYNAQRKQNELETITREVFEITMTKIEKEWHTLERRIPKPNPKPPQTHRPRSGSAAAVNGETQGGEEPDSKCVICDDGDCENTNAIVFCDGCNLAVHQECYGVPFIPEGQWLCRKCQLCGRGVPTCIFCPNTDGAFKQTNSSKWAHLLCAMWIPEVSLGNHTFMEPVMDVEKVPKTRWKLSCYICHQKMGACIQCSNKNCYQAFHVTCARRAHLYLKMKTSHGALAVLDGTMVLKAFCDKHCPPDYTKERNVHQAARSAKKFYKRNMRGRIWADSHAMANVIAAQHRSAIAEHLPDESLLAGAKTSAVAAVDKKKGEPAKNVWKLPSGAPIIPQAVFDIVEASIQRFPFRKRKDFLGEACRYWTLKREARRGAALLKRLQLQMETFTSMELTRRNFASMGPSGKARLARRIEFAEDIINDLEQLKALSEEVVQREQMKLQASELEQTFVDECYFPVATLLAPAIEKAILLDKDLFSTGLDMVQNRVGERYYVNSLSFAQELGDVINAGIVSRPRVDEEGDGWDAGDSASSKSMFLDIRERRKLGKRILKAVQPYIETALRVESEILNKPFDGMQKDLESLIDASIDTGRAVSGAEVEKQEGDKEDTIMVDAPDSSEITVKSSFNNTNHDGDADLMDTAEDRQDGGGGNIEVNTSGLGMTLPATTDELVNPARKSRRSTVLKSVESSETPPDSNDYVAALAPRPPPAEPPTPPQSNGSFGKEASDPLAEGGILWYLKSMKPRGTSILGEHWAAGMDAVRMLSEDLTDLDDEELKGLGRDVNSAVTASAMEAEVTVDTSASVARSKASNSSRSRKRRASGRKR